MPRRVTCPNCEGSGWDECDPCFVCRENGALFEALDGEAYYWAVREWRDRGQEPPIVGD